MEKGRLLSWPTHATVEERSGRQPSPMFKPTLPHIFASNSAIFAATRTAHHDGLAQQYGVHPTNPCAPWARPARRAPTKPVS